MTLLRDERRPVARLIPITSSTGVEAKEFGRTLLEHQAADVPVGMEIALERADAEAERNS